MLSRNLLALVLNVLISGCASNLNNADGREKVRGRVREIFTILFRYLDPLLPSANAKYQSAIA